MPVTFNGVEVEVAEGGTFTLGDDLIAGSYTVYAIDDEGCTWSKKYTITEPSPMRFEVDHIDASCEDAIGAIWIDTIYGGGTKPYWKWGITTELPFIEADAQMYNIGDTAKNLYGDIYYVRLYDANGCFEDYTNAQGDDAVKILTLDFDYALTQPKCSSDSASVRPFLVSGDGNHDLEFYIEGYDLDTLDVGQTLKLPQQSPGTTKIFQLRIYDKTSDCGWGASLEVKTPEAVWLDIHERYTLVPTCPGGTDGLIAVTAGGGKAPYIYKFDERQWVEAEDFTTFAATAGEHTIVVRDANGCEATATIDLDMDENLIEFQDTIFTDCTNDGINLMHQIGSEDNYDGYENIHL